MPLLLHPRRCAAAVALVVFAIIAVAGVATHREPALAVPAAKAERLGAADARIAPYIHDATRWTALHVDDDLVKVVWYRRTRIVAWAGVRRDGSVVHGASFTQKRIGYGAPLSHHPLVLGGLALIFLGATLRRPLRSRHTACALAVAACAVPTALLDQSLIGAGELSASLLLAGFVALGVATAWGRREPAGAAGPSLLEELAGRWRLPNLPWQLGLALLGLTLLMTVTSTGIVDVAQANMEGATLLLHGVLPYGHMPGDVVHGDTYGLPIYLVYAPFASVWPMHDDWSEATGSLVVAALATMVLALGFERASRGGRWPTLIALLSVPSVLMSLSSGTNDMLIAAALIWALAWFTRPAASSALLMAAGLAKAAPVVLLPLWLARLRGRDLRAALIACVATGAAVLAGLVALGGVHGPLHMLHAMAFQLDRRSELSVWTALPVQALQPLAQALVLAVAVGGAVLVALDRAVAADPRRVAGLVTAVLAGLQLAANHWMPLYLLWLLPPAMIALLGPLGAVDAAMARRSSSVSAGRPSRAECPSSATPSWAR